MIIEIGLLLASDQKSEKRTEPNRALIATIGYINYYINHVEVVN